MSSVVRHSLTRAVELLSRSTICNLDCTINYLEVGSGMRACA